MTFTTSQDRARASAPTGSLMKTPDYLEALVHKDLKPFGWRETVEEAERLQKIVERDERRKEASARRFREAQRRKKLEQIERAVSMNRGKLDFEIVHVSPDYDLPPKYLKSPFRSQNLISLFCRVENISMQQLLSKCRERKISVPRQILMWILKKNTNESTPSIGRRLGDRDHSTIIHGIRKIQNTPDLLWEAQETEKRVLWLEYQTYSQNEGAGQ